MDYESNDDLITCENCGNMWDGYAQCNCWTHEMYMQQFEADNGIADEENSLSSSPPQTPSQPQRELPPSPSTASHRSSPPQKEVPEPPTIKAIKKTIDILKSAVSQLFGGLYNQQTQQHLLEWHLQFLFEKPQMLEGTDLHNKIQNILHEDHWPTTRQGDEHETKIKALMHRCEEQAKMCEAQLKTCDVLTQLCFAQAQKLETQTQKLDAQTLKIAELEEQLQSCILYQRSVEISQTILSLEENFVGKKSYL
jgi:hypothetical protein